MSDVVVRLAPSSLQRVAAQLGGMGDYLRDFSRDLMLQEAALAARAFIKFSPPIPAGGGTGDSNAAKKQGYIAVAKDVRSFVTSTMTITQAVHSGGNAYQTFLDWKSKPIRGSGRIANLIHADSDIERAWGKAKNIAGKSNKFTGIGGRAITSRQDLAEVHDKIRQQFKGRIRHNRGPGRDVRRNPYTAKESWINSRIAIAQMSVGTLSHYWWEIIMKVPAVRIRGADRYAGRTGVPEWIRKSPFVPKGQGRLDNRIGVGGVTRDSSVTITNTLGNIFGIANELRIKAKVVEYRNAAIAKRPWQKLLEQACLISNAGGRPR